ncbi:MAG: DNA repair protein RecO [Phycisphaerales bacterium]|nr:DNA repair protein RecO [Phycisphaerales bacterium]
MPSREEEGICIRHWDYSETSQTVGLFSRTLGSIRAIAKGSRRERSGFSGGVDLLTRGTATLVTRPGSDLSTLMSWDLIESFPHLRKGLRPNQMAHYCADLVGRFFQLHDPHTRVYDGLCETLRSLGADSDRVDDLMLLRFQWLVLTESGYQPVLGNMDDGHDHVHFEPREGGALVGRETTTSWKVRRSTMWFLIAFTNDALQAQQDPDHETVVRSNRLLAAYSREILGDEPFTMRALFGELATRAH